MVWYRETKSFPKDAVFSKKQLRTELPNAICIHQSGLSHSKLVINDNLTKKLSKSRINRICDIARQVAKAKGVKLPGPPVGGCRLASGAHSPSQKRCRQRAGTGKRGGTTLRQQGDNCPPRPALLQGAVELQLEAQAEGVSAMAEPLSAAISLSSRPPDPLRKQKGGRRADNVHTGVKRRK